MANKLSDEEMKKEAEKFLSNRKISGQVLSVERVFDAKNPQSTQIKFTYRGSEQGSDQILTKQETIILKNNKLIGVK